MYSYYLYVMCSFLFVSLLVYSMSVMSLLFYAEVIITIMVNSYVWYNNIGS